MARIEINGFVRFALTGGILDCTAYGVPPPKVTWLRLNPEASGGIPATEENPPIIELASNYVPNAALWQILAHNNSLKFRPFSASEYNVEVHRATYICKASSESGTILSRIVQVKAGKKIQIFFKKVST